MKSSARPNPEAERSTSPQRRKGPDSREGACKLPVADVRSWPNAAAGSACRNQTSTVSSSMFMSSCGAFPELSDAATSCRGRWAAFAPGARTPHGRVDADALKRCCLAQMLDICAADGLDLAELMQGRIVRLAGAGGLEPVRSGRRCSAVDHDSVRQALIRAQATGQSLPEVAKELRVDLHTLARHRDLYVPVREAAVARRALEEETRHLAAIAKVESMALALVKQGRRLTLRNAWSLGGSAIGPNSAEGVVSTLMRIGLGDRSVRLSVSATRIGSRFLRRINEAVERVRAEVQGEQLSLALEPD